MSRMLRVVIEGYGGRGVLQITPKCLGDSRMSRMIRIVMALSKWSISYRNFRFCQSGAFPAETSGSVIAGGGEEK